MILKPNTLEKNEHNTPIETAQKCLHTASSLRKNTASTFHLCKITS